MIRKIAATAFLVMPVPVNAEIKLIDPDFAASGIFSPADNFTSLQPLKDGGFLVTTGTSHERLDAQGRPVTSFGVGGAAPLVTVSIHITWRGVPYREESARLASVLGEDARGGIMMATQPWGPDSLLDLTARDHLLAVVGRLTQNGFLDPSFGEGGLAKIRVPRPRPGDICQGPALLQTALFEPNGRMYLVGTSAYVRTEFTSSGWPNKIVDVRECTVVVKLDGAGRPDPRFGERGVLQLPILKRAWAHGAHFGSRGTLVVTGLTNRAEEPVDAGYNRYAPPDVNRIFRVSIERATGNVAGSVEVRPLPKLAHADVSLDLRYSPTHDRWVGLSVDDRVAEQAKFELHVLEGDGRPVVRFGRRGRIAGSLSSEIGITKFGLTGDGGVYALGMDTTGQWPWEAYRLRFCRWRPNGSADNSVGPSGCGNVATPTADFRVEHGTDLADDSVLGMLSNSRADGTTFPGPIWRYVKLRVTPGS